MLAVFKRYKTYRAKRELAHLILAELLPEKDADTHKKAGIHYFVTMPDGSMFIQSEQMGLKKLERGYVTISVFRNHFREHTEEEIVNTLNLLIINGHVEVEDKSQHKSFETVGFSLSPKGRLAYDDEFYLNQKAEQANREISNVLNWLNPALTLFVAAGTLLVAVSQLNKDNNTAPTVIIKMDSTINKYITSPQLTPDSRDLKKSDTQFLKEDTTFAVP
jgi:hypothetical protein